jgi:hypothetical protein
MLRTLQKKGTLVAPNGSGVLQQKLDKWVPYEYITEWIHAREGLTGIENRILIIQSSTGSGKSVTIPAEIYIARVHETFRAERRGIICTQPRIITAVDNARKIASIPRYAEYLNMGENIGVTTMPFKLKPRRIALLSATEGVLSAQLSAIEDDAIMNIYKIIIIDEAHERSPISDILISALKSYLQRNANDIRCPFIVLMSATIDTFKFARFFLDDARDDDAVVDNIIMCIDEPEYTRNHIWAQTPIVNIIDESVRIIRQILREHPAPRAAWDSSVAETTLAVGDDCHDIIIFVPGINEIRALNEELNKLNEEADRETMQILIVQLTRESVMRETLEYRTLDMSMRDIARIYHKSYERRIILATNVAETGITINTLRYVIESGFNRDNEYNPFIRAETLISKPASQSRVTQRSGRVGRKFAGTVYHLYTRDTNDSLLIEQLPSIFTSNLAPYILPMVAEQQRRYGSFKISRVMLMDVPSIDMLLDAISIATNFGFIVPNKEAPQYATNATLSQIATKISARINADASGKIIVSNYANMSAGAIASERADASADGFILTPMGEVALTLILPIGSLDMIRAIFACFAWHYRADDMIAIAAYSRFASAAKVKDDKTPINMNDLYRELLPSINNPNDDKSKSDDNIMKQWHLFLGDTFCDAIVLAQYLDNLYKNSSNPFDAMSELENVAKKINATVDSLIIFMKTRDSIGCALIEHGYNICVGTSVIDINKLSHSAYIDTIINYKRCLYDGFRANLVQWDNALSYGGIASYRTITGAFVTPLMIEKTLGLSRDTVDRPQILIFNQFRTNISRKTSVFEINAEFISVLDGFVGIDTLFTQ